MSANAYLHPRDFGFAALGLPDDMPFPQIGRRYTYTCCVGWQANASPDWRPHEAQGIGRE